MAFPKPTPNATRLIPSRQLIPGSLINDMNDANYSYQLLTAAGVAQSDSAKINAANVEVANGSANNAGVQLVAATPGAEICILNNSLNTTLVYPNGTDQIQNAGTGYAAASASVSMATLVSWRLHCIKTGFWQRIIMA